MRTILHVTGKDIVLIIAACLLGPVLMAQAMPAWPTANFGKYKVGFKSVYEKKKSGEPLLISIWYPAAGGGQQMTLQDYIVAAKIDQREPDTTGINAFKNVLELPFLFHLPPIQADEYRRLLSTVTNSYSGARMQPGKFPLVIAFCPPQNYISSFEMLASNGFCVASVTDIEKDETNESLYYVKPTAVFAEFLDYMCQQPFVDTNLVSAMGHGWGIQAPFYLAMQSSRIGKLINLDGGVFVPRSKTDRSPDYHPARLKVPMLHITTVSTRQDEDPQQFAMLTNPRFRINILSDSVSHHDFSTYGRVVGNILHKRPGLTLINNSYNEVHRIILDFLLKGRVDSSSIHTKLVELQQF